MVDEGSGYASYDSGTSSGDTPPVTPADGGADQSSTDGPPAQQPNASSSSDSSSSQSSTDGGDPVCADAGPSSTPVDAPSANGDGSAAAAPGDEDSGALMTPADGASTEATSSSATTEDIPVWPHAVLKLSAAEVAPEEAPEPDLEEGPTDAIQINKTTHIDCGAWDFDALYTKVEGELTLGFSGTLSPKEKTSTSGWDDGFAQSFSSEFEWGEWKIEPELTFKRPVEKKDPDKYIVEIEGSGSAAREWSCMKGLAGEIVSEVKFELAVTACRFAKSKTDPDAEWEVEVAVVKVTAEGGYTGKVDAVQLGYPGIFDGSISVEGELKATPNWKEITARLVEEWGAELTCEGVLAAFGILAAGIASVSIAVATILEAWKLEEMRDVTIPTLTERTTRGYMDGVGGRAEGAEGPISDEDGSYKSGAAQGSKKRDEIVAQQCNGDASRLDDWLAQGTNSKDVEDATRAKVTEKLQKALWTKKADDYANSWKRALPGSDTPTLEDQYNAWIYIIGNSPASLGGDWMALWLAHRVEDTDHADRSAGSW